MIDLTPYATYNGPDLDKLGADLELARHFGECDESYRGRMIARLVRNIQAGSDRGEQA